MLWDTFYHRYHLPPIVVPADGCIVDLGANVGYTAAHFAALYQRARILAVEMDGSNAAIARQNLAASEPRCTVLEGAVWCHDGEITYGGNQEWGFRVEETPTTTKRARAMTIDTLIQHYGLNTIHYLKMDIEGAEAEVLKGPLAWASRVRSMKVEVHPPATVDGCARILTAAGFHCQPDPGHAHCVSAIRAD